MTNSKVIENKKQKPTKRSSEKKHTTLSASSHNSHSSVMVEILQNDSFIIKFLNGSEKKLIKSKDDPGVALNVYIDNLERGLNAINAAPIALPLWMVGAAYPISKDYFIRAALVHAQGVSNGGIVDNFCIAPNSSSEIGAVSCRFCELNIDPFVIAVANAAGGALVKLHLFHERKVIQNPTAINIPLPMALTPPNIQAFI